MFGWFGNKKRDDAWMKQPRRLPDGSEQQAGEETRWILSREFAEDEKKNERMYMAVEAKHHDDGSEYWSLAIYSYDLAHGNRERVESWFMGTTDDPIEVIRAFRSFEKERREADFVQIDGSPPTYRAFANHYGVHFDDDGRIFKVEKEQPLAKATFMNRKSLDALFQQKQKPIESWEDLYAQLVDSWPQDWVEYARAEEPTAAKASENQLTKTFNNTALAEGADKLPTPDVPPLEHAEEKLTVRAVTLEDLVKDPAYPEFAYYSRLIMKDIEKLSSRFEDGKLFRFSANLSPSIEKRAKIKFSSASKAKLAQRLADATFLVGVMRIGAEVYTDIFSGKKPMSAEMLNIVGRMGDSCAEFAETNFALTAEQSKKVADLLSHGADPFGPALPLEKIFAQFPPAEFNPSAKKTTLSKAQERNFNLCHPRRPF